MSNMFGEPEGRYSEVYYHPEKFGLVPVFEHDQADSYEFDKFVIWKNDSGEFFFGQDSGCSCPSPFENQDCMPERADLGTIQDAYNAWRDEDTPDNLTSIWMRLYVEERDAKQS